MSEVALGAMTKPRSATPYVGALVAAAGVGLALSFSLLATRPAPPPLVAFVGLAALTAFLQRYGLIFHWRGQRTILSLDEPAIFVAFLLLPAAAILPMVLLATLAVQVAARRERIKLAFNVAHYALAGGLAAAAFAGLTLAGVPALAAAAIALPVYTLSSELFVAGVFAILERASLWRVYLERYALVGALHMGLGLSVAIAGVALWQLSPLALLALAPLAGGALLLVNLQARSERENQARERLARMVDSLSAETDLGRVAQTVLETCGDIFHAGSAQLELMPHEGLRDLTTWTWGRAFEGGPAHRGVQLQKSMRSRSGAVLGTITITPSARAKERYGAVERGILRIVCAQAASTIENAVALRELLHVRSTRDRILQNIPAGVAQVGADGRLLDANAFLRRALQLPDDARSLAEAPAIVADAGLLEKLDAFVKEGREFRDHDLVLAEGASGSFALMVSGVRLDAADAQGGGVLLFNDVTQRHLAEELRKSETVTRPLMRRIVLDLVERLAAPQQAISAVGRSLASEVHGEAIEDFVRAFRAMGLGELSFESFDGQTYVFNARDLVERRKRSRQPSCHLTLGFTEGAIAKLHAGGSLGTEVRCQSQGHEACQFMVVPREPMVPPSPTRRARRPTPAPDAPPEFEAIPAWGVTEPSSTSLERH